MRRYTMVARLNMRDVLAREDPSGNWVRDSDAAVLAEALREIRDRLSRDALGPYEAAEIARAALERVGG